jgi:integrase
VTRDLVFPNRTGGPLSPNLWRRRRWQPLVEAAEFPQLRPHDLRHTHATLLLDAGVAPEVVAERLGHSTMATTLRVYAHVLPGRQREALDRLRARSSGSRTAGT